MEQPKKILIIDDGNAGELAKALEGATMAVLDLETIPGPTLVIDSTEGVIASINDEDVEIAPTLVIDSIAPKPRQSKCEHGVYIPADDPGPKSRYCNACNLDAYADTVHTAAMARRKSPTRVYVEPETDDCAEYMTRPVGERIAQFDEAWL